jgi:hypothetical protein
MMNGSNIGPETDCCYRRTSLLCSGPPGEFDDETSSPAFISFPIHGSLLMLLFDVM